ncbi:vWA domain-containing protein [Marispirochaeta aestuarii]|uniref:vWA domain-containing protein n=1 Tax=Marispirochaeta aestuarii TaxID=1963862 RepID=UPI0029C62AF7|nr:vWA domain-containing protein [Marispirochaeta aestuarii]
MGVWKVYLAMVLGFGTSLLWADPLEIAPEQLVITQSLDGGYDLYVQAVPGRGSVLLTESTEDPERETASYAYRNPEYHRANGDEKRLLNGVFLEETRGHSLIDSTPEEHPELGQAFHIFIPYLVLYGYPWTRSGEVQVLDGTYLSIRAFEKPFADYTAGFLDNPFVLKVIQKPFEGPPEGNYMDATVEAYQEISDAGRGKLIYSRGEDDILEKIAGIIDEAPGRSMDLVLALDTTQSMTNDMPHLRKSLVPLLREKSKGFDSLRVGVVLYKDYDEEYVTDVYPFQTGGVETVQRILDRIRVYGGRDIPEAVYEALYAGIHSYPWSAERRLIVLVGDAPPHPRPRGKVTKEMVYEDAESRDVELYTIILPQ